MCSYVHMTALPTAQTGFTPLHGASEEGLFEVVDTLLKHGADPNLVTMVWAVLVTNLLLIFSALSCP